MYPLKTRELTQPKKVNLEHYLRVLLKSKHITYAIYQELLSSIGLANTGHQINWQGMYGKKVSIKLNEEDVRFFTLTYKTN
jgi:hypothetical protein